MDVIINRTFEADRLISRYNTGGQRRRRKIEPVLERYFAEKMDSLDILAAVMGKHEELDEIMRLYYQYKPLEARNILHALNQVRIELLRRCVESGACFGESMTMLANIEHRYYPALKSADSKEFELLEDALYNIMIPEINEAASHIVSGVTHTFSIAHTVVIPGITGLTVVSLTPDGVFWGSSDNYVPYCDIPSDDFATGLKDVIPLTIEGKGCGIVAVYTAGLRLLKILLFRLRALRYPGIKLREVIADKINEALSAQAQQEREVRSRLHDEEMEWLRMSAILNNL